MKKGYFEKIQILDIMENEQYFTYIYLLFYVMSIKYFLMYHFHFIFYKNIIVMLSKPAHERALRIFIGNDNWFHEYCHF